MGESRIGKDSAAGRHRLEVKLERRRGTEEGDEFKAVRRGWCPGDERFREELLAKLAGSVGQQHGDEVRQETAEAAAERIVREELKRLRWKEGDLPERRKGDPGKVALARRLRDGTTMTLKWIARRVRMGSASIVTHCLVTRE